jgi:hypothetical protein
MNKMRINLFVVSVILFLISIQSSYSQNYLINPTTDGGFEGVHGWTILNTSNVNKWIVGSNESTAGSKGAYVSNDNSTNTITNPQTTNSKIYIYKDVIVPLNATSISISFKYKNSGFDNPAPRCLFELTSACPPLPTNGASMLVGSEFATFLNNATNWTTYTNNQPFSSDRPITYTSEQLIPGESYRIVFEWSAAYQTNYTQQAPICTFPTSGNFVGNLTPTPNSTETYTYNTVGGSNFTYTWTLVGGTILSGQGTNQISVFFPSTFSNGQLLVTLNCPPPVYTSNGKNSGPLSIDEVAISYVAAPKITNFSPNSGAVGSSVTINGEFFGATSSDNIVTLGGVQCPITSATSTSITVTIPTNANFNSFTVLNTTTNLSCISGNKFIPTSSTLTGMSYSSNSLTSFEAPKTFVTGTFPSSFDQKFVLSDIDSDGKLDIVSYSTAGNPQVLKNNSTQGIIDASTFNANVSITGVSQTPSQGFSPKGVATADLNNDGKLDFAMSNSANNGGFININSSTLGTPSLQNYSSLLSSTGEYQVNAAFLPFDINLDGRIDIFGINGTATPQALLYFTKNTSAGTTFSSVSGKPSNLNSYNQKINSTSFYSGVSGDIDGDGKTDVVLGGTGKIYVLTNSTKQGNPDVESFSFAQPLTKTNLSGVSQTIKLADLDLDGKLDIIASNSTSGAVSVYKNLSSGTTTSLSEMQNITLQNFSYTVGIGVGDMNGDGKPDLIVSDNFSRIGYLENTSSNGTISFAAVVTLATGVAYSQIEIADIDGDSKPDIIASTSTNTIAILRNRVTEAGVISSNQTICSNTAPAALTSVSPATFPTTGTITYKWQSSNDGSSWTDISSTNTLDYTIPGTLSATKHYRRAAALLSAPTVFYFTTPIVITVTQNPTITSTTPASSCGSATLTLAAVSSGSTVNWYDASTNGTLLGTGLSFITPTLSSSTTYYAQAVSSNGCLSSNPRTAVAATIVTLAPSISSGTPASRCDSGSVTLAVTVNPTNSFGAVVNWYSVASGGTSLGTGTSFVTPSISATTTYYAEISNCNGAAVSRTAVIATIINTPTITSVTPNSGCKNTNVVLSAVASYSTGVTINWYTDATTTSPTGTGSTNNAFVSAGNVIRYVSAKNGTCESQRTAVTATMNDLPAAAVAVPTTLCGLGTATVSATSSTNTSISWFAAPTGGSSLGTGSSYTSPSIIANSVTFYALVTNAYGCIATSRTAATATYNGATFSNITNVNAITNSTNKTFTSSISGQTSYIWQRSTDSGLNWVDITANLDPDVTYSGFSGTTGTTATLTISVAKPNLHQYQYRLKLTKSAGCDNYSNAATLYVAEVFGTCTGGTPLALTNTNDGYSGLQTYWDHVVDYETYFPDPENNPWQYSYQPISQTNFFYFWGSMTDGDEATGLIVHNNNPSGSGYVTNNLGTVKIIDKVFIQGMIGLSYNYGDGFVNGPNFDGGDILVSTDNINWTTVVTNISGTGVNGSGWGATLGSYFTFPAISAKYVRVSKYKSWTDWSIAGMSEFYVYEQNTTTTPYILTAPITPVYISTGATFSPNIVATASTGTIASQWSKSNDNSTFTNLSNSGTISGVTTSNLNIASFAAGNIGYYKLTGTQSNGCTVSSTIRAEIVAPYYTSAAGSSAMQTLGSWNTNSSGVGGSAPANFTTTSNAFVLANSTNSTYTAGTDWINAGTLRLNGNIFTLGNYNATIGSVIESSATAFVKTNGTGQLISNTSTVPNLFPVGNSSYNPVTITNNTGTADTFSVSVSDGVLDAGTTGNAMTDVINRTWKITKTNGNSGGYGVDLTFAWTAVSDVSGLVDNPVLYAYVSGTGWVAQSVGSITRTATSVTFNKYMGALNNTLFMLSNAVPTITSFTPTSAGSGVSVVITGTALSNASAVNFGGTPATSFVVNSATQITAVVASGTSGNVSVNTPGGTASLAGFTFVPSPIISYFTPYRTNGATTVTITGTNFNNASAVSFGGTNAVTFTVVSSTVITAVVGTGTSGNVVVTTPGGIATAPGFVYGIPYSSIDVLAGWNTANTSTTTYPYLATYKMDTYVSSASTNYSSISTDSNSNMTWINSNSSASLDTSSAPYLSFSIDLATATKFDRLVFPGLNRTTSKMQLRWNVDSFSSSLGEISSGNGTDLLSSINLASTAMQSSGPIEFRVYFYNGSADVIAMKSGNSFTSSDGTAPSYDSNYAIAFYGATKLAPTIGTVATINKNLTDPAFTLPLPSSNSTGTFTFSSSDSTIISINGSLATINGIGTATITATQAATETYSSGSTTFSINVKTIPTLFLPNIAALVGASPITLNATSNSNGAITYTSGTLGTATIAGNSLSIVAAGTSVITISQAASGNYTAATVTAILTVGSTSLLNPTLSNFANSNKIMSNPAFSIAAPTSNSAGGFTYYSSNTQVATVSGSTITLVAPGISIITAVQSANGNYRAGSISAVLTVGISSNSAPTISSMSPMTKFISDDPFTITSPTSNSSEAFIYFSSTPSVGSVNNSTITLNGLGTSTITAVQTAGGGYNAGSTSTTLTVMDELPSISYVTPTVLIKNSVMTNLEPTLSGGTVISYSILPSLPVGLAFNTATGIISGTPLVATSELIFTVTATNLTGSSTANFSITIQDLAPDAFSYSSPNGYTVGTTITVLNPIFSTSTGGDVVSFSISPSLPAGLVLSTTSGKISGTPSAASELTTYTVTAINSGGNSTASLQISVGDLDPSDLEYSTPNNLFKGIEINPLHPSYSGGAISSYAISPNLPAGLQLDSVTGEISGTPSVVSSNTSYTITGTNDSGSTAKTISLTVNDNSPSNLTYTTPNQFTIGSPITNLTPTNSGGVVSSYSITPALPAGLSFNTSTGEISGTPTALMASQDYVVTAINFIGNTQTTVAIAVIDIPMSNLVYSSPNYFTQNEQIGNNVPTISGGTVVSYSITPALPAGLQFDTTTGIISGIPTTIQPLTTYTITALNSVGTTRVANVNIAVTQFCGYWGN